MCRQSVLIVAAIVMIAITVGHTTAEDPPASPPATTTSPAAPSSTHKLQATETITGKVVKATDSQLTIKVTYHTGGKGGAHSNLAHISGGWLPHLVAGEAAHVNPKSKPRTITQTITYHIGQVPPVKVVTDGPHPSRTTGSYSSDIHVGDTVWVGTAPVTSKTADGKSRTEKTVTGIDVTHHLASTTATTTTNPSKN